MIIKVTTIDKFVLELDVQPGDSVDSVKARMEAETGIEIADQRLICKGKGVYQDGGMTLGDFNIMDQDVVYCVFRIRDKRLEC